MITARLRAVWTSVDYELDWPPELLAGELRALFDHPYRSWTGGEVELLLTEAFHTEVPAAEFTRLHSTAEWTDDPAPTRQWIADLFDHLPEMRRYTPPRPYWAARRASLAEAPARDPTNVMYCFDYLVGLLHARGYLARDFAQPCVDVDPNEQLGRDLNVELRARLHNTDPSNHKLWPLQPETWDTDTFTDQEPPTAPSHGMFRSPGSGCPQLLPDRCDGPAAKVSHLHSITWRLVAHDRLVRHTHSVVVGKLLTQPLVDLLGRPLLPQPELTASCNAVFSSSTRGFGRARCSPARRWAGITRYADRPPLRATSPDTTVWSNAANLSVCPAQGGCASAKQRRWRPGRQLESTLVCKAPGTLARSAPRQAHSLWSRYPQTASELRKRTLS